MKPHSLIATALLVSTMALPMTVAQATTSPSNVICSNSVIPPHQGGYTATSIEGRHVPAQGDNRAYGSGGGSIQITRQYTWETTGSLSTSVSTEIDGILAAASVSVETSVALSSGRMIGSGYTYNVPADVETAYVEYGNWGHEITWTKGYIKAPCTWVEEKSGTGLVITGNPSYIHGIP